MPSPNERAPRERETLMYETPEQANQFRERVAQRLEQEGGAPVRREREVVAEAVADELSQHGHGGAERLDTPWQHSPAEHTEAQKLVDVAFEHDLAAALRQARQSDTWPRNLDLFHDVLTNELYELVRDHKLNRQPLGPWLLFVLGLTAFVVLVVLLLIIFG